MTQKSKVYTKGGDKGQTSLVGGQRVDKSDLRIDLYGDVDELNSHVGVVTSLLGEREEYKNEVEQLMKLQSILFDLGSNLACEVQQRTEFKLPQIKESAIKNLESEMDRMDEICPPLKTFVLPGGARAAAALHICRTVCRRVERKLINFKALKGEQEAPVLGVEFLNRLSDYFFVLSRYINTKEKKDEVLWIPQRG